MTRRRADGVSPLAAASARALRRLAPEGANFSRKSPCKKRRDAVYYKGATSDVNRRRGVAPIFGRVKHLSAKNRLPAFAIHFGVDFASNQNAKYPNRQFFSNR